MSVNRVREGLYWKTISEETVQCLLCPFHCRLREGKRPICRGREYRDGKMVATNYGRIGAMSVDPIEKKPLYHFLPGRPILSVGPNGCNLACDFCQNATLSQREVATRFVSPDELADNAVSSGSVGVAYTYAEPLIWYEYLLDASAAVRDRGLANVLVSNGLIEPEPFERLAPLIDAMNIDLKSMDERFYKNVCKGPLQPVLETIKTAYAKGIHLELTNLVIPGLNDAPEQIERLIDFVAELDPGIPLHFSRYHPAHEMDRSPTPTETLLRAAEQASGRLSFVYVGNVDLPYWRQTRCPECGAVAVDRNWFGIATETMTDDGRCGSCGAGLGIVTSS